MPVAPLPTNEAARLKVLADYQILDTATEAIFDSIAMLASKVCNAPISLITFIDENRQWFKSTVGVPPEIRELPRAIANCAYTILNDELLEIQDLTLDPRFSDNPINQQHNLKFYAGVPLTVQNKFNIGTLCVLDVKPQSLTEEQKTLLKGLSQIIVAVLDGKKGLSEITLLGQMLESSFNEIFIFDTVRLRCSYANKGALKSLNSKLADIIKKTFSEIFSDIPTAVVKENINVLQRSDNQVIVIETLLHKSDGKAYPTELRMQLTTNQTPQGLIIIANDISMRKQAEEMLITLNETLEKRVIARTVEVQSSLALLEATLQSTTDAILVVDNKNHVVNFNMKYASFATPQAVPKIGLDIFIAHLVDATDFIHKIDALHNTSLLNNLEEVIFKDGRIFDVHSEPQMINQQTHGRVWSFRDVTVERNLQKELIRKATHDVLTDVPNRLLLEDRLRQAISQAITTQTSVALMMIDVDRFKVINDTYSHQAGDILLQEMAKRLKLSIRANDTVARLGGDEFIVLLTLIHEEKEITMLTNKILSALSPDYVLEHKRLQVSVSIGISVYPKDTLDPKSLMANADIAMYRSKEFRHNHFHFFAQEMHERAVKRLEVEKNLVSALAKDEFFLVYQPILHLSSGQIIGAEALIRWQHPILGLVPPLDFIPVAEELGTILPIGELVLKKACSQVDGWHQSGHGDLMVSINISTEQFKQKEFISILSNTVQQLNLDPRYVELEITESMMLYDMQAAIKKMHAICELGFVFVIDDFGTGYSSLSYLKHLPIYKIKIDQSFVGSIQEDSRDASIIVAIIAMAKSLKIKVLAEGVETKAQFNFLLANGCDEIQGYYLSKPLTKDDFKQFLENSPQDYTQHLKDL